MVATWTFEPHPEAEPARSELSLCGCICRGITYIRRRGRRLLAALIVPDSALVKNTIQVGLDQGGVADPEARFLRIAKGVLEVLVVPVFET